MPYERYLLYCAYSCAKDLKIFDTGVGSNVSVWHLTENIDQLTSSLFRVLAIWHGSSHLALSVNAILSRKPDRDAITSSDIYDVQLWLDDSEVDSFMVLF